MQARKLCLLAGSLLGCLVLAFSAPAVAGGTFTTFDVSGAGTGALQGTFVKGIDAAGDVAGSYVDASGTSHGFVRAASGTITTFDVPGATTGKKQGTFVATIDPAGDIAGYYTASTQVCGFVRAANGTISTFAATTEVWQGEGTEVSSISSVGAITGEDQLQSDAFVRSSSGTITSFGIPAPGGHYNYSTAGIAINTAGVIAGKYVDNSGVSHGFVRSAAGAITTFDPTGVATQQTYWGDSGTLPTGIDTAGDIAGTYTDTAGERHSFVRTANGTITTFDPQGTYLTPCSTSVTGAFFCGSGALGMNDAGQIVGAYIDDNGTGHGFLREANGYITTVDITGAGMGSFQGTGVFAINAAGTLAGTYVDTNSVLHGFVGTPPPTATTTSLNASQTASVFGEPASFTATISSVGGSVPNGETVYFLNGTSQLGSSVLNGGTASFTTTELPVGTDSVTASYDGDADFAGSTSTSVGQTVGKATSSTTLTSSPNPSVNTQSVTLTANISGQFSGTATGMVTFSNGGTSLGTAPLSGNSAVLATSALPPGSDSVTATYNGDSNFGVSSSNAVSQVVMDFSVAATPTSQTVTGGQNGTTSISVTPANGFNSAVTFSCSGLPSGASCGFLPQTVTPSGSAASTTLTVTTTTSMAAIHRHASPFFPISALAALVGCVGWKRRRLFQFLGLIVVGVIGLSSLNGCGGGTSGVGTTPPQSATYTITVNATSGSLVHSTPFSLTVN
jgi:hypothetical protein